MKRNNITQEEINLNNKLLAEYMSAIADTGETKGWFGGILFPHGYDRAFALKYSTSMDWLYPVYQKIVKYHSTLPEIDVDKYTETLLVLKLREIHHYLFEANDIFEIFKEIVEWIKIYNLKVLEDDKT